MHDFYLYTRFFMNFKKDIDLKFDHKIKYDK